MNHLPSERQKLESKIAFLQQQLDSLDHYLPETYQYLMAEMDQQQFHLMELKIQDFYEDLSNEHQNQNPDKGNSDQDQKSNYGAEGVCK